MDTLKDLITRQDIERFQPTKKKVTPKKTKKTKPKSK